MADSTCLCTIAFVDFSSLLGEVRSSFSKEETEAPEQSTDRQGVFEPEPFNFASGIFLYGSAFLLHPLK